MKTRRRPSSWQQRIPLVEKASIMWTVETWSEQPLHLEYLAPDADTSGREEVQLYALMALITICTIRCRGRAQLDTLQTALKLFYICLGHLHLMCERLQSLSRQHCHWARRWVIFFWMCFQVNVAFLRNIDLA